MDREHAEAKLRELRPPTRLAGLRTQGAGNALAVAGDPVDQRPSFGLGLALGDGPDDYKIAIRIQDPELVGSARVAAIEEAANGEVDIAFVGLPCLYGAPVSSGNPKQRMRPLVPGISVSTTRVKAAGTLGCFVKSDEDSFLLSNNHVIADCNSAAIGTPVVQPGRLDGGSNGDQIGELSRCVPVDSQAINRVDCALAVVNDQEFDPTVPSLGRPSVTPLEATLGMTVAKRGRTTNVTTGLVTGVDIELLIEGWPDGPAKFVELIEVMAPPSSPPFAAPGDSGSLIMDEDLNPVALLTAGRSASDGDRTYGTPIAAVLEALKVDVV